MEKEKKTIDYRVEKDSIGTKDVPEGSVLRRTVFKSR